MDVGGEQGRAEPQEWSRWAMICVLGCAGVALVCMSFYLLCSMDEEPDSRLLPALLFLFPGIFLFAIAFAFATEQRHGVNPDAAWSIDKVLLF
jgi:hypothetical protein